MKRYNPQNIDPRTNQFFEFVKDKVSEPGRRSVAYHAVLHLFKISESLYRTLAFYTDENLSIFSQSQKYLTVQQEHDLIALTAHYISSIDCDGIYKVILADQTMSEEDRTILKGAVDLYKIIAQTSVRALGSPQWV